MFKSVNWALLKFLSTLFQEFQKTYFHLAHMELRTSQIVYSLSIYTAPKRTPYNYTYGQHILTNEIISMLLYTYKCVCVCVLEKTNLDCSIRVINISLDGTLVAYSFITLLTSIQCNLGFSLLLLLLLLFESPVCCIMFLGEMRLCDKFWGSENCLFYS